MMNFDLTSSEYDITSIEPVYDFENAGGGYFNVYFLNLSDEPFKLSFVSFLDYVLEEDDNMFQYVCKQNFDTASHAIQDLYDLGYFMQESVKACMDDIKGSIDQELLKKMFDFLVIMNQFKNDED